MASTQRFSGAKIREARHAAGLTQAALANAAGTRERNIIRWENDQHAPRFEHVASIARATGQDIAFFLESDTEEEEEESDQAAMMRAAYHLDRAGEYQLADDLRIRARKAVVEASRHPEVHA